MEFANGWKIMPISREKTQKAKKLSPSLCLLKQNVPIGNLVKIKALAKLAQTSVSLTVETPGSLGGEYFRRTI